MQVWLDQLRANVDWIGALPAGFVYTIGIVVVCKIILVYASLLAGETVWLERRISGRMQARIGPNRVGPQGLLQFLADGVKLLAKEDIIPATADKPIFLAAPIIVFVGAFAAFAVIPFGDGLVAADRDRKPDQEAAGREARRGAVSGNPIRRSRARARSASAGASAARQGQGEERHGAEEEAGRASEHVGKSSGGSGAALRQVSASARSDSVRTEPGEAPGGAARGRAVPHEILIFGETSLGGYAT